MGECLRLIGPVLHNHVSILCCSVYSSYFPCSLIISHFESVNRLPFHIQNIIIMVVMKLAIINKSQIWDSYIRVPMHMIQITSINY